MTEQEKNLLIEEAKQRFPINSVIISTHGSRDTIKNHSFRFGVGIKTKNNIYYDDGNIELYNHDYKKWAEVVSKPESNELKVEDLVDGKVYYGKCFGYDYLFISNSNLNIKEHLNITRGNLLLRGTFSIDLNNLRLATPEEKQWLEACIKANKFIPKEEALKSETKYVYEVVHCKTQDEWDFVLDKLNYTKNTSKDWSIYKANSCLNINKDLRAELAYYLKENAKIYSFQEWCDKFGHKPDFKPKFEVGKWYKDTKHEPFLYIKFSHLENDNIFSSERISGDGYFLKNNDLWLSFRRNWVLLTDLSEIQPYLPDGHPDKLSKQTSDNIPEYVECVKGLYGLKVGSIYSVNSSGKVIDGTVNNYRVNIEDSSEYFKPSTKEAFKNKTGSLFSKNFNNPLNKVLELPKSSKKKTKQLIY